MAITLFASTCVVTEISEMDGLLKARLVHKLALPMDICVGIAILIIGILGLYQVIPLANNTSHALIGLGSCYAGLSILVLLNGFKQKMSCTQNIFIVPPLQT